MKFHMIVINHYRGVIFHTIVSEKNLSSIQKKTYKSKCKSKENQLLLPSHLLGVQQDQPWHLDVVQLGIEKLYHSSSLFCQTHWIFGTWNLIAYQKWGTWWFQQVWINIWNQLTYLFDPILLLNFQQLLGSHVILHSLFFEDLSYIFLKLISKL